MNEKKRNGRKFEFYRAHLIMDGMELFGRIYDGVVVKLFQKVEHYPYGLGECPYDTSKQRKWKNGWGAFIHEETEYRKAIKNYNPKSKEAFNQRAVINEMFLLKEIKKMESYFKGLLPAKSYGKLNFNFTKVVLPLEGEGIPWFILFGDQIRFTVQFYTFKGLSSDLPYVIGVFTLDKLAPILNH